VTAPDTTGPTTTVGFYRAGVEVARETVPGYLLEIAPPASVQLRRPAAGEVHLVEDDDPFLECCGRLLLPWVNRHGPGTTVMDIPPPLPFDNDDLRTMWTARNRLTMARRPPTSGDAEWARLRRSVGSDVDWQLLELAVWNASVTLSNWPARSIPSVQWLPTDRTGGRILVGVTERSPRSHALPSGPSGMPALTARRSAAAQPRTLHALAAVAALLANALEAVPGINQDPFIRDRLTGLFRRVAQRSLPSTPVADPPPSSWPRPLSATYAACVRALTVITAVGPGSSSAPLSELWELYQAWCAEALRAAITAILGPSGVTSPSTSCIGQWSDGSATVELHYQPKITTGGAFSALGQKYQAAISDLEPDLLLLRQDGNTVRRLVLDPKKRSGLLGVDDLTLNASKYLWGIRAADQPARAPILQGVLLLAPLGGAASAHAYGLADTLIAHPRTGIADDIVVALLDVVRGGASALPPRAWKPRWS